jgi:hypothetical protein
MNKIVGGQAALDTIVPGIAVLDKRGGAVV